MCVAVGGPEPILDPPTDLPHRAIATVHVRTVMHTQLFNARNRLLQQFADGRCDHPTSFHLSIDHCALWHPLLVPGSTL